LRAACQNGLDSGDGTGNGFREREVEFSSATASGPAKDQRRVADLVSAMTRNQREFSAINLPLRRKRAAQLPRPLADLQLCA
jgi:hypothetical protein